MQNWVKFSGIAGLVIFMFGFIGSLFIQYFLQPLFLFQLIVGGILIFIWLSFVGAKNVVSSSGAMLTGSGARFGFLVTVYTVAFASFIVLCNWLANSYNKRIDLTEQSVYSLSPQSRKIIDTLKKPAKIIGFRSMENAEKIKDTLNIYSESGSKLLTTEVIDARSKPHLVEKYEMKPGNLVYIQYGEGDKKAVTRINEVTEESITNALLKLTAGDAKKIYYVIGHDEPDPEAATPMGLRDFKDAVSDDNLTFETILLAQKGSVPQDAAAVILSSPKKPLLLNEKDILIKYAEEGGRLLLFNDPRTTEDIKEIANRFNLTVGNDVVLDQVQRLFAGPAIGAEPVIQSYGSHEITKGFTPRNITIFRIASTVKMPNDAEKKADGPKYVELLKTGPSAWGEMNLAALFDPDNPAAELEDNDTKGPVSLAVAYEKEAAGAKKDEAKNSEDTGKTDNTETKKLTRVVVFGDSDVLTNAMLPLYSNRDLVLNTVNWAAGVESGVTIRAKSIKNSIAPIGKEDFTKIFATSFLIPQFILLFGLFIWWKRRQLSIG
jgi:hypothetical protein